MNTTPHDANALIIAWTMPTRAGGVFCRDMKSNEVTDGLTDVYPLNWDSGGGETSYGVVFGTRRRELIVYAQAGGARRSRMASVRTLSGGEAGAAPDDPLHGHPATTA
jgi:hypothetical protein